MLSSDNPVLRCLSYFVSNRALAVGSLGLLCMLDFIVPSPLHAVFMFLSLYLLICFVHL